MLILPQFVEVELRGRNIKWYVSLGYEFNKMGQKIVIPIEHLQRGSQVYVDYYCDYCLEKGITNKLTSKYNDYNQQRKKYPKDCCDGCCPLKIRDKTIQKYGVDSISKVPEIQEKRLKTFANKSKVEVEKTVQKRKNTNLERYGVEHPYSLPEIKEKAMLTKRKNGTQKTSKQQVEVYKTLIKNGYNAELNYPLGGVTLDVALFIDGLKIDVEYDGWYWHQDQKRDRRRDEYVKSQGWKIFRIKGGYKVPTLEQMERRIRKLINNKQPYTVHTMEDWIDKSAEGVI